MSQHLFLDLSSGQVPSPQIRAVHLDTFHTALDGDVPVSAVAVWLKGQGDEPLYFARGTLDAEAVSLWALTQPGEQFLALPGAIDSDEMTHFFAADAIETADIDEQDNSVRVKLFDDPLFWWFSPRSWAAIALLLWDGVADMTLPRVTALLPVAS